MESPAHDRKIGSTELSPAPGLQVDGIHRHMSG